HEPLSRTIERLASFVDQNPDNVYGQYWYVAMALNSGSPDRDRVRASLAFLEAAHPTNPSWLAPWLLLRSAQFAIIEGRADDARRYLAAASEVHDQGPEYEQARAKLNEKLSG